MRDHISGQVSNLLATHIVDANGAAQRQYQRAGHFTVLPLHRSGRRNYWGKHDCAGYLRLERPLDQQSRGGRKSQQIASSGCPFMMAVRLCHA